MTKLRSLLLISLLNAITIRASPINSNASAIGASQAAEAAELAWRISVAGEIGNTKSISASCSGQSCQIAALSGSTGKPPTIKPAGGDPTGYKCIAKYSPETVAIAEKNRPGAPAPANGGFGILALGFANVMDWMTGPHIDKGEYTCGCKKNIVIYARGTTEIGVMGEIVGPFLSNNLSPASDWEVCGVYYTANLSGDYCVGLPGGMVRKCPFRCLLYSGKLLMVCSRLLET